MKPNTDALLKKVKSLVAKNRAAIADKVNVDEPAIARRDDQGKEITGKSKKGVGEKGHIAPDKRQFHKLHNEYTNVQSAPVTKPVKREEDEDRGENDKGSVDNKGESKKSPQIVMYPDESEYGNVAVEKKPTVKETYIAWLKNQ